MNDNTLNKIYQDIESLINFSDDTLTKENANKDAKVVTSHRDLIAGIVSKQYTLDVLLPENISSAHKEGYIHFHDMDYSISPALSNCCLVNYRDMLENGLVSMVHHPNRYAIDLQHVLKISMVMVFVPHYICFRM